MEIFRQGFLSDVGRVIDYQTPLKNRRSDKAGKIDLLSYDGISVRILELKEPDSDETMLRCVLEGYTYMKTVDGKRLINDFELPELEKLIMSIMQKELYALVALGGILGFLMGLFNLII